MNSAYRASRSAFKKGKYSAEQSHEKTNAICCKNMACLLRIPDGNVSISGCQRPFHKNLPPLPAVISYRRATDKRTSNSDYTLRRYAY